MELLYNPDQMPESEVKETFVAREQLLEDLVELIKSQPDGGGVQHAVIIAPRGMGKTTVLLMVKFAVKDRGLADQWQAVKFPEESYGIYDLADLWIQTLELIAADTGDAELRKLTNDLKIEYPKNDELQEAAYAAIRYWRRKHGKRLLLLVENFDQILEQINDERDNARLRDVLMNDGTIMILGGATNFFKEARAYDQPLYNFFKIYDLADLKLAQMQELLRRRAKVDRIADFETKLKRNASRLRALKYFTGGNPRLVLMLYRVVSRSNVTEVRRALEKLLDEVTPYYKAKVEMLPPQQRKILDHIARVSGETNEGLTPKEIAEAVRLSQNQISSQLKRLSELGYVQAANLRGRSSYYTLSEPLYAIWHQMRFGRESREKLRWLVNFLKAWYSTDEIGDEEKRLRTRFLEFLNVGRVYEAWELLEPRMLLADAIIGTERYRMIIEGICIDMFGLAGDLIGKVDGQDLLKQLDQISPPNSDNELIWLFRGILLGMKSLNEGAIASFDQALKINAAFVPAWLGRGLVLVGLERFDEAITSLDKAGEIEPNMREIWKIRGSVFSKQGHYEQAIADFHRAINIKDDDSGVRKQLGYALVVLDRYEEAIANYDRAFELNPDDQVYWFIRGALFAVLGRHEEAIESWRTAVQLTQEYEPLSEILLLIAQTGELHFVRKTIAGVGLEKKLFPLARAIDYLQIGDEALIEKLSPEVRGIVEEVVAKLKETYQSGSV